MKNNALALEVINTEYSRKQKRINYLWGRVRAIVHTQGMLINLKQMVNMKNASDLKGVNETIKSQNLYLF